MKLIASLAEWQEVRAGMTISGRSVGFVPTMGNLHRGHVSLLERSRAENDISVLSIFVNSTQFNSSLDLEAYPRTLDEDLAAAEQAGTDFVLNPSYEEIYPDDFRYVISEKTLSKRFCGAHRPGHFDGVLTVVMKLLMIVRPERAYFGEKDYQQYLLIRDLADAFFLQTQIVPCPLVRDADGLALSSRNRNLTPQQRKTAGQFPKILRAAASVEEAATTLAEAGFAVDYVEDFEGRRLAAVTLGSVRLIDNIELASSTQP